METLFNFFVHVYFISVDVIKHLLVDIKFYISGDGGLLGVRKHTYWQFFVFLTRSAFVGVIMNFFFPYRESSEPLHYTLEDVH